jgi:sugar lactone lactonase YvrE
MKLKKDFKGLKMLLQKNLIGMFFVLLIVLLQSCGGGSSTPATVVAPIILPKIYLTDSLNGRIVRLDDLSGNSANWTSLPGFLNPGGITLDSTGKIYVSDSGNNRIVRMDDMTGTNWTAFVTSNANQFTTPTGIFVVTASGNITPGIYVTDTGNSRIVRMDDMNGTNWISFGSSGSLSNQFLSPAGIFVTSTVGSNTSGIYVTDTGNSRIVRMDDMNGTNWIPFGSSGSSTNQFLSPAGIFVTSTVGSMTSGIYVTDTGNNRIVRMDNITGANWSYYGSSGNGVGQFNSPTGIFIDSSGRIYVSDTGNHRIVRFDDFGWTNWVSLGPWGVGINQLKSPTFAVVQ